MQKHREAALYILLNSIPQKLFLGYSGDPKDFLELLFLLKINAGWMDAQEPGLHICFGYGLLFLATGMVLNPKLTQP